MKFVLLEKYKCVELRTIKNIIHVFLWIWDDVCDCVFVKEGEIWWNDVCVISLCKIISSVNKFAKIGLSSGNIFIIFLYPFYQLFLKVLLYVLYTLILHIKLKEVNKNK
jgi:hypothetical protein